MAVVAEIVRWISAGVTAVVDGTPRTAASVNAGLTDLANRTRWLKDRMYDLLLGAPKTISAVDTALDRITVTGHGIGANIACQVFAANGGTLPGGLAISVVYYANVIDANTLELSATSGPGASVDLTAGFSGDCYIAIIPDWLSVLLIADSTWGYGKLTSLVCFLAGSQAVTGAKTFSDAKMSGTAKWGLTSRGVSRFQSGPWSSGATPSVMVMRSDSFAAAVGETWIKALTIPNGATLTKCTLTLDPGAHGALPAVKTSLAIVKRVLSTNTPSYVAAVLEDPAADVATYNPLHAFDSNTVAEVINNALNEYYVAVAWESGANSIAGDCIGVSWTATVTSQDDAAS